MSVVRARLVRGLLGGLLHEVAIVILSFAAMIVLVRLLSPAEYGQAGAAIGVLALIGAFRGAVFAAHALQYGKDEEPDWDSYFAFVGIVQLVLCGTTVALGLSFRALPTLAPLSPLLLVAALGFLVEWPAQIGVVRLQRQLQFERLKLYSGLAIVLRLVAAIVLAWLGFGAMALIISGNVLPAVPMAVSLLVVERWRPRRGWLFLPAAAERGPVISFGVQQIAVGFTQSLRTALEGLVLTKLFGLTTFGLINRAAALYQSTIGRLALVFEEIAYPLLPRERADPERYAHRASRFLEVALILSICGAAYIAIEGPALSRVLYGQTWVDADPFLRPAAVAVAAAGIVSAAAQVLMGVGRVRSGALVETVAAACAIAALAAAVLFADPTRYLWVVAATQVLGAGVACALASPFLDREWRRRGIWPAAAASLSAALAVSVWRSWVPHDGVLGLAMAAAVFAAIAGAALAVTARQIVAEVMQTHRAITWKARPPAGSEAQA